MTLLEVRISPKGYFATPLTGDGLFGHLCNQVAIDPTLLPGGIDALLGRYDTDPVVVVGTPLATCGGETLMPSPAMPLALVEGQWGSAGESGGQDSLSPQGRRPPLAVMSLERGFMASTASLRWGAATRQRGVREELLSCRCAPLRRHRASSDAENVDYGNQFWWWYNDRVSWSVPVWVDATIMDPHCVAIALARIGELGYGAGASRGLGRFGIGEVQVVEPASVLPGMWFVTLGASLPTRDEAAHLFYRPVVRHGRHSVYAGAYAGALKTPLRLADTGAVGQYIGESKCRGIVGRGITRGISAAHQGRTVHQAYAPVLPFVREELSKERSAV